LRLPEAPSSTSGLMARSISWAPRALPASASHPQYSRGTDSAGPSYHTQIIEGQPEVVRLLALRKSLEIATLIILVGTTLDGCRCRGDSCDLRGSRSVREANDEQATTKSRGEQEDGSMPSHKGSRLFGAAR
jgi:hypothetical protein